MRIGIDARLYRQTGVGRYLRNLIAELTMVDDRNEYIVYFRREEFNDFVPPNKRWVKKIVDLPWHTLKEQLIFPIILQKDELHIAHFPYFNVPIFYPGKYLLTVHDLIIDHFDTGRASTLPTLLYKVKRLGYKLSITSGIKRACAITAISETTKQELIDHYNVSSDRITVTYDALDNNFKKVAKTCSPINYFNVPYILYVGNAYPHKNLERLFQAFRIIRNKKRIKLVLAGEDNYFYPRLKRYASKLGLEKKVVFFGNANDIQLVNLYTYSECLVFPSLMEGFGLPNFEALYCNCLPVISDITAFREIWTEKLPYFNPYDSKNIADKILEVLALTANRYRKRVEEAKKRIYAFNWRSTTLETLRIYNKIYQSSRT
ncbi:glycosyltransferase family 4 protein [Candidatus Gottesmanbacteria bacterium]|nr:glycosyltransferase family 4 protein [Candidatus Gottesmanbacteria bacterium]